MRTWERRSARALAQIGRAYLVESGRKVEDLLSWSPLARVFALSAVVSLTPFGVHVLGSFWQFARKRGGRCGKRKELWRRVVGCGGRGGGGDGHPEDEDCEDMVQNASMKLGRPALLCITSLLATLVRRMRETTPRGKRRKTRTRLNSQHVYWTHRFNSC